MEDDGSIRLSREEEREAAAALWRWRCRICHVECEGVGGMREHCMSQTHYDGLQVFAERPELFLDSNRPLLLSERLLDSL